MDEGPARIRDLLGGATKNLGVKAPVETARIWSEWRRIVGEAVAGHAEPTSLKNGVLRVRADSPAWATEISYLAAEIRAKLNAAIPGDLVSRVEVWTGPRPKGSRSAAPAGPERAGDNASDTRANRPPGASKVDPETAFLRARRAWAEATRRGFSTAAKQGRENTEKPW